MQIQILRSVLETASQVGLQLSHDPASTMTKVHTRLGSLTRGCDKKRGSNNENVGVKSQARKYFDTGQLSKVKSSKPKGLLEVIEKRALRRAADYQLEILQTPILESKTRTQTSGSERPLYVLTSSLPYTQSGYTVRSHQLLSALRKAGSEVEAVTRSGYPASIGTITRSVFQEIDGVRYTLNSHWTASHSPSKNIERAVQGLVKVAVRHGATVLHTTTDFKNALVVSRAANILDVPWVYEIRGELEQTWLSRVPQELIDVARSSEFFELSRKQEQAAREAAAAVFVISEQIKSKIAREGIPESKLILLPNAVDKIDFKTKPNNENLESVPGLSNAKAVIGTVSALVDYEGLDTLVRSLEYLPSEVHVLVVGDGSIRQSLELLAKELGVQSRTHFVGKKPASTIQDWYRAIDVFVVPRKDSELCRYVTPIKAMQAQAMNIPVVASDLPALREVTGGFADYVKPESPKALATKVKEVLEKGDPDENTKERLKSWLKTRTWDANAKKILETLSSI